MTVVNNLTVSPVQGLASFSFKHSLLMFFLSHVNPDSIAHHLIPFPILYFCNWYIFAFVFCIYCIFRKVCCVLPYLTRFDVVMNTVANVVDYETQTIHEPCGRNCIGVEIRLNRIRLKLISLKLSVPVGGKLDCCSYNNNNK